MKTLACTLLGIILLYSAPVFAQGRGGAALVSPQVAVDHKVTFRVRAPKATEVSVSGDWLAPNTSVPMTKDAQGVWSVTVGPLQPGLAIYTFTIDGVTTPDPINPRIKLRASTSASLVDVPADPPALWEARDVPHGNVQSIWQKSAVTQDTRFFNVYTPPGYDPAQPTRYPVLYLLHGSNGTAADWTDVGKANFIEDNLIAEKKAVPMIIVMPWGHAARPYSPRAGNNNDIYEQYLVQEVIPTVDRQFHVAPGRENRAIVGLSMGGGQALQIGWSHMDLFSQIGAFSFAIPGGFEQTYKALLDDPAGTNAKLTLMWMGCGTADGMMINNNKRFADMLTAHQIKNSFHDVEGGRHVFYVWRDLLTQIAPVLFRGPASSAAPATAAPAAAQ